MITILATNAYKAAYKVRKAATPDKRLPVSYHILVTVHDGRLVLTPFRWEERAEHAEAIPARVEKEFSTCIPARAFVDWLRVTQEKPTRANPHGADQIKLTYDPEREVLHVQAGNTRAEFKCIDAREFPA